MQGPSDTFAPLQRPLRDLLLQLPLLLVNAQHEIDYAASDPALLVQIAVNAQACQKTVQRGLSCIGYLLAHAAPELERSDIPGDCIEALGLLLAELGDLGSVALCLTAACRRHTGDYQPNAPMHVPNVKP